MIPASLLGPMVVVVALVPGAAVGLAWGRSPRPLWVPVLGMLALELTVQAAVGVPCVAASAYAAMVGRAARRVDPRLDGYAPRVDRWGDLVLPLVAPGVFAGSALAFAAQAGSAAAALHGVGALVVAAGAALSALLALAIDRQHADALAEAAALRGCTGPALLPHYTVAEHAALAPRPLSDDARAALAPVWERRPRHLDERQRALLARCIDAPR